MKCRRYIAFVILALTATVGEGVAAPVMEASAQKYAARPGALFPVSYTVSWEGGPGDYTVLPLTLPELDWGRAVLLESRSRSRGDRHETLLVVGYISESPGTFEAPPLAVRVLEWHDAPPAAIETVELSAPALVLEAPAVEVTIRRSRAGLYGLGLFAILLGVAFLSYFRISKRKKDGPSDAALTPREQAQALLHQARRHRLDGDLYAYYRALHDALVCVVPKDGEARLCERLRQRSDDTGYRGARPSDDDLEGDFKDVERIVAGKEPLIEKET